jgi:hypothetical protein
MDGGVSRVSALPTRTQWARGARARVETRIGDSHTAISSSSRKGKPRRNGNRVRDLY